MKVNAYNTLSNPKTDRYALRNNWRLKRRSFHLYKCISEDCGDNERSMKSTTYTTLQNFLSIEAKVPFVFKADKP